jgi:hypothetical protein
MPVGLIVRRPTRLQIEECKNEHLIRRLEDKMAAGLKNGTRAFAVTIAVCAALSPVALVAAGGVSAEGPDATAARLVRPHPARVIRAADGGLDAGAPGVTVEYHDARKPGVAVLKSPTGPLRAATPTSS